MSLINGIMLLIPYLPMVKAIPPNAPTGANNMTLCNAQNIFLEMGCKKLITRCRLQYLLRKRPMSMAASNTCKVELSINNFHQLKSADFAVYLEISPPSEWVEETPSPGRRRLATAMPMMRANVVTTSKYKRALTPNLPTFFRLPMEIIPNVMVRKIIGLINIFTMLIKVFPKNSERVAPTSNSCPRKWVLNGSSKIFKRAKSGRKCPSKMPSVMAVSTQKVRLVNNFFIAYWFEKSKVIRFSLLSNQGLRDFFYRFVRQAFAAQ